MNFDHAFAQLMEHEGGYSDHAADPGGRTRFGITEKVARSDGYTGDMRTFPVEWAKAIYRASYWDTIRAEDLPTALRYPTFDAAVNSGPRQAVRWLQRAVGAHDDGVVGPQTITMARAANPDFAARRMIGMRLEFMTGLSTWPAFSRGWTRRMAEILQA